ncbi:MAG: PAS domain-containing protein, partial [Deltaproteobacteria bacterium]|nr:PAS domain-containing protein [Deltaproteobacteria bacterium]
MSKKETKRQDAKQAQKKLQKPRKELAQRVEELTAELLRLNRQLRREIERRAQAEEFLRESEERLRDITFNMADWVWEVDEHGVYTYSTQNCLDFLGRSREDVIGKTPFDFMPPEEAKRVAAIFSEIAANKAPIKDLENWNIGKNGESICFLTNAVPLLDEEGNLKGYRGVDKDITERKRTEEELQTSEEKFREFFKNTPDYCYIISMGGNILHINEAALKTLGYKREELVGQPIAKIYAPESLAKMEDLFTQWKENGQIRNEEMMILTRKGERRSVILNAGAVKDKDGTILHSTSVQTDITERKRAEIEALNARRELLRLERLSR